MGLRRVLMRGRVILVVVLGGGAMGLRGLLVMLCCLLVCFLCHVAYFLSGHLGPHTLTSRSGMSFALRALRPYALPPSAVQSPV